MLGAEVRADPYNYEGQTTKEQTAKALESAESRRAACLKTEADIISRVDLIEQAEKQLSSLSERQAELLEQTRAEQNRLIQQASRERERIIESAKAQAQAEADKILQNAKNEIRAEKQSALRDLSALVSSLSVQVAEKIVRHKLETDPQEQIKLIDSLIEEASRLNDSAGVQRKA